MGNSPNSGQPQPLSSVHPHVHGELLSVCRGRRRIYGSSPRAWGTHGIDGDDTQICRFIPTCMGNSFHQLQCILMFPVHPHVHGELSPIRMGTEIIPGSSPRAWGTLRGHRDDVPADRFIPTCMGNSGDAEGPPERVTVHPHVHGELLIEDYLRRDRTGSSPRAWGTRKAFAWCGRPDRFIPTCMGNSSRGPGSRRRSAVHPHVHGELRSFRQGIPEWAGSSPRAWGTRGRDRDRGPDVRFIPTCMGNSRRPRPRRRRCTVHPHVHGELPGVRYARGDVIGSSPRAWGTHLLKYLSFLVSRFIPTCMGNSRSGLNPTHRISVHPHVHGELS